MEELIKQTLSTIARLGNSKQVAMFSVSNDYNGILIGGLIGGEFTLPNKTIEFKNTFLEKIVLTKQILACNGTLVDLLPFPISEEDIQNSFECLCLPFLNNSNEIKGIAVLSKNKESPLSTERLQTLTMLSPLMITIMETTLKSELMGQLSTQDNLTGLYTRHYFETRLQEELSRSHRHGGVMSLLLIDIDHFTQINGSCGYKECNRVLQEIAKLINTLIRKKIDIPCRYDSKQFIILSPNTNVDGAYILGERIRRCCEQHFFTTLQGIPLKLTLSVGIAHNIETALEENSNPNVNTNAMNQITELPKEELIHRTELMLYAAKQAGRNKVMVWW